MGLFIAATVFFVVGGAFTFAAVQNLLRDVRFVQGAQRCVGTVTGYRQIRALPPGNMLFAPVISFVDPQGRSITFHGHVLYAFKRYRVGATVRMLVGQEEGVLRVGIDSLDRWFGAATMIMFGLMFVAIGVFSYAVFAARP